MELKHHRPENSQPEAITEMIAQLVAEGYEINISPGAMGRDDNGTPFATYSVIVVDAEKGEEVALSTNYFLVDAMSEAYQATPENKEE